MINKLRKKTNQLKKELRPMIKRVRAERKRKITISKVKKPKKNKSKFQIVGICVGPGSRTALMKVRIYGSKDGLELVNQKRKSSFRKRSKNRRFSNANFHYVRKFLMMIISSKSIKFITERNSLYARLKDAIGPFWTNPN